MYKKYFGLADVPFSIAPDPRYLYMSDRHREALAHLLYGIHSEGCFVLLTGEVGTGKTTVCRCLLEQIPENCDVAVILNPRLTAVELLATICKEFGIPAPRTRTSVQAYVDKINEYLLDAHAKGRKAVLIIDEAQNLDVEVLEQMRLLTNLETNRRKLLQIVLLGQPELRDLVERPVLRQLAQRITARYHLVPLSKPEVSAYVAHRLAIAGGNGRIFPSSVIRMLWRLSGGIPRLINVLCDRAMLGTYIEGKAAVTRQILARAAREVLGDHRPVRQEEGARRVLVALLGSAVLVATLYYGYEYQLQKETFPAHRHTGGTVTGALQSSAMGAVVSSVPLGSATSPDGASALLSAQGGTK